MGQSNAMWDIKPCLHAIYNTTYLFSVGDELQKAFTSVTFAKLILLSFHETKLAEESNENRFPVTRELQTVGIFEFQQCGNNFTRKGVQGPVT